MYAHIVCIKPQKPSLSACLTENPKQHICPFFSNYKISQFTAFFFVSQLLIYYMNRVLLYIWQKWKINKLQDSF